MSSAPLISNAFISAAEGRGVPLLRKCWRSTAAAPATSGVAMLVPPMKQYSASLDAPQNEPTLAARECADRIAVPGATTSGL